MKFIFIVDNTTTNQTFVNAVKEKIENVNKECSNVYLDMYVLHEGKSLDSDTSLLIKVLSNEKQRCPLIVDAKTAKYFPEILRLQSSIVMFEHETNRNIDVNEYNSFNETLAAAHGSRIDYIDKEFHDMENNKSLSVIDIQKHLATWEYYIYLAKIFYHEHKHYPSILLSRSIQQECKSKDELVIAFEHRYEGKQISWNTTAPKEEYDDVDYINTYCIDIAIHSLSDRRLNNKNEPFHLKNV